MSFGVKNTVIPPAPSVNPETFNVIALVGIAPLGPENQLIVCSNPTDDLQFGNCLTGFGIPRALRTIRQNGGGEVVVVNVFSPSSHTSPVINENQIVLGQKCSTALNPLAGLVGAVATIAIGTPAAASDTLASLTVNGTQLLSGLLTFVADATTKTEAQIAAAINANSLVSGYTAIATTGLVTITGPALSGCVLNGIVTTVGTITGTVVLGTPSAFAGGIGNIVIKNTPVSPVSAVAATATVTVTAKATIGDTLAQISIGSVGLLASPITFVSGDDSSTTTTAVKIVARINANTSASGYTATNSGAVITISGTTAQGASLNGITLVLGTITGATLALGSITAFASGVTAVSGVSAYTYIAGQDYTLDVYGNVNFLTTVSTGSVVRVTYNALNPSAVNSSDINGSINGSTYTGLNMFYINKIVTGLAPKYLIVPNYNALTPVKTLMETIGAKYRMQTFYGPGTGLSIADAIASRGPSGPLATFNTISKNAILGFDLVYTYDEQIDADNTFNQAQNSPVSLDDPSASMAGFMSWNASVNGPQNSPSNLPVPSVLGTRILLGHDYEDANNAADANQLRAAGIACFFNNTGGFFWWGGENASYPTNGAVDCNISVMNVYDILTDDLTGLAVQYIDRNITSGSIASFTTAANGYYGDQASAGTIGPNSIVSYIPSRNNPTNLSNGLITFTRNTFYYVGMKLITLEENMQVQLPSVPAS